MSAVDSAPRAPHRAPRRADRTIATFDWVIIAIPAILAAVLGLIDVAGRSIGFDEGATVTIAAQHGSALGSAIAHDGGNMSGYYLLLHVLIGAFGNGELVIRLPSVIANAATAGITAAIALALFDRRAAVASGVLCAVSLPLVFWAQSARGYALMVAFVAAAFLILAVVSRPRTTLRSPRAEIRTWPWVAYVVVMTLATYSSYVAVLAVPAQLVILLPARRRRHLRALLTCVAVYALLCVPLFVLAVRRGSGQLFWVPRPTHKIELQVLEAVTSAGLQPSFHRTATTIPLLILTLLALIVIAVWIARSWWRGCGEWGLGVALAWLCVPVGITFCYSLIAQPLFQPRNVLMCVVAVALLLGAALTHPGVPRIAGAAALVALVALRALAVANSYGVSPEPWQQAAAYVQARARPGDCIAFYPLDGRMAFQYYIGARTSSDQRAPRSILPVARWGVVKPFVERYDTLTPPEIATRGAGCRRMWFVSSHEGQTDGPAQSLANRARFLALRARLQRAFGHARVIQLGYAAAIHIQLLPGRRRPQP